MMTIREGRSLGLEQRGNEEWMSIQFDRADVAVHVSRAHPQRSGRQSIAVTGTQAVAAMVLLDRRIHCVDTREPGRSLEPDLARLFDKAACERGDHGIEGGRILLGMSGLQHPPDRFSVFEQRVLES